MLRTTNKQVKTALVAHVLEHFLPINYGTDPETTSATSNLIDQITHMQYGGRSIYQTALDFVEGGSLLVYYDDQRKFLKEILEETDEEANRYDNDKVFRLYCHLVARTIATLVSESER